MPEQYLRVLRAVPSYFPSEHLVPSSVQNLRALSHSSNIVAAFSFLLFVRASHFLILLAWVRMVPALSLFLEAWIMSSAQESRSVRRETPPVWNVGYQSLGAEGETRER